jgi:transcriptional regulator with XRE-family HTH domain
MSLQKVFIENMKKWRKSAGLSQEKLALKCDTAHNYIRQIEAGLRCPSFGYIERIAAALGVAPHQLFYDESHAGTENIIDACVQRMKITETVLLDNVSQEIKSAFEKLY